MVMASFVVRVMIISVDVIVVVMVRVNLGYI